ncbi:MAG: 2-C-methyl-D-erythritol 2,4-cyclodiphosphate synthase [Clostridiales bacterium]|nr:2-C-methyl-D-erythritol 2,4-cyclodiphosphate synthase [Clostridiales bacterium]
MEYEYLSTIGQDSHRFEDGLRSHDNFLMLGGVKIPFEKKFSANSDGDVVLHALNNAISGYTGINILGGLADRLCLEDGIKDSSVFLKEGLKDLGDAKITHVSISIECLRPKIMPHIPAMRARLSELLGIPGERIGITATTGEGLTGFGRGEGVQVLAVMTFRIPLSE